MVLSLKRDGHPQPNPTQPNPTIDRWSTSAIRPTRRRYRHGRRARTIPISFPIATRRSRQRRTKVWWIASWKRGKTTHTCTAGILATTQWWRTLRTTRVLSRTVCTGVHGQSCRWMARTTTRRVRANQRRNVPRTSEPSTWVPSTATKEKYTTHMEPGRKTQRMRRTSRRANASVETTSIFGSERRGKRANGTKVGSKRDLVRKRDDALRSSQCTPSFLARVADATVCTNGRTNVRTGRCFVRGW